MYKESTCKIAIFMKFSYELYSYEGLSLHFETFYGIYLTHEYSHILPGSFFEPTTIIYRTQFLFTKKYHKFLNKSIYFWLAFKSYCFHGHA